MSTADRIHVVLTRPQVQVLHETLSMIENDPDWVPMIGGAAAMNTLNRAHNAIMLARLAAKPKGES